MHVVVVTICGLVTACGAPAPSGQRDGEVLESAVPPRVVSAFASQDAGAPGVGPARLDVRPAGELSLPQGRVAVSDAFINDTPLADPGEHHRVECPAVHDPSRRWVGGVRDTDLRRDVGVLEDDAGRRVLDRVW